MDSPPAGQPELSAPLRLATPDDHAAVLGLIGEYYAFDGIDFGAASVSAGLNMLLADPRLGIACLIERGQQLAGYLILTFGFDLEFGGRQATVTDLYLRPEARGSGLGAAALTALEDVGRRLGLKALELQVERDNLEAQAFYTRLGFTAHDRVPLSKRL